MIGNAETIIKWLFTQDRNTIFEVKEHKAKRSLNANAYLWVLVGKIADRLRASKDEIYLKCLKLYGQSEIVSVLSAIDVRGFFKYYEPIGTGHVDGREFTHYRIYKGSSEYDTREMAVLIDGVISEAKELDIETLPPHEIERMKQKWNRSCKRENTVTSAEGQTDLKNIMCSSGIPVEGCQTKTVCGSGCVTSATEPANIRRTLIKTQTAT